MSLGEVESKLREQNSDFAKACLARQRFLSTSKLAYYFKWNKLRKFKVYVSKDYTAYFRDDEVACLSAKGGFVLSKDKASGQYRVDAAVTASEVRRGGSALEAFLSRAGYKHYGIGSHLEPANQPSSALAQLAVLTAGGFTRADIARQAADVSAIDYCRRMPGDQTIGPIVVTGRMVLDDRMGYVVTKHSQSCRSESGGREVWSLTHDLVYSPPTEAIPFAVAAECVKTLTVSSNKPEVDQWTYTDYAIEPLPRERLRLSYYGLPNELIEDEPADLTAVWVGAGVLTLIVATVVIRRRRRTKVATA